MKEQVRKRTHYLDVDDMKKLVSRVGFPYFISMLIEQLKYDFSRWEEFEKSPRTANHCAKGVIELMPISDGAYFSYKYVNGHPVNPSVGLPTVMSYGSLAEMDTGVPLLISEMTILTALRTAATSVLAASLMANPEPELMAMIGNGAQSEFQILAFYHVLGVKKFRLYDVDPLATKKVLKNLSNIPDIHLIPVTSASEAVLGCDIVTTCTADKKFATILTRDQIENGMHLNAIGGDCPGKTELEKEIVEDSHVVVEFTPQSRVEGEIQQMSEDFPVIELHEIITGHKNGRESAKDITLFDSVGFSLEDFSALKLVYELSQQKSIGSRINILPEMNDVKNLYGELKDSNND
jgi:ornithine cyclodeaminase